MKHLLLYTDMAGIYGAEQCTHALALALAGAGYRVTVAQPHAEHHLIAEREAKGVAHHWLAPDNLWDHRHAARALTERAEPERVLTATAPDLVVFSDGTPFSSLTAKEVAADRGIPYLAIVHCVTPAWASQFAAHLARLPSAFARADAVVAVSQENLKLLRERFGLPAAKGIVIHNGRPDVFFAPRSNASRRQVREELRVPPQALVCLTVGRFDIAKGYQYQLASFRHLRKSPAWPDLLFVWVGGGTHASRVPQLVRLLRADDKVRFPGPRGDVPALLDAADIFVLPSQFEGMPLAVLEAMAKGLPVIATAVSGIPEALGNAGCLLPDPGNEPALPEHLAAAISGLALDAPRRRALGSAARARAQAHFREAPMVARYRDLIEQTLGAAG
jgi:glycosyltransferase involved in cell wall biosynthesis